VLRYIILATIVFAGLSLACSPAMAEEPQQGSSATKIEEAQKTVVPLPTTTHRTRLSTRDRWRGKPHLRSGAAEASPSQATDVALPPANSAFLSGGVIAAGF
jgi:hypothetical protein